MFEELNNEEMMEIDGGFSWRWFAAGVVAVVGTAGSIAIGVATAGAGAPVGIGIMADLFTVIMGTTSGMAFHEAANN